MSDYNNIDLLEALVADASSESTAAGDALARYLVNSATFSAVNSLVKLNSLGATGYRYTPKDPERRAQVTVETEERMAMSSYIASTFALRTNPKALPVVENLLAVSQREAKPDSDFNAKVEAYGLQRVATEVDTKHAREQEEDAAFEASVKEACTAEIKRLHSDIVSGSVKLENKDLDDAGLQRLLAGMAGALHNQAIYSLEQGKKLANSMPDASDELLSDAAVAERHRKQVERFYLAMMRNEDVGQLGDELKLFSGRKSEAA